jgi:hypothetical protein
MRLVTLEAALHARPFRPFELRVDSEVIRVDHPEQVFLADKRTTAIIDVGPRIHIVDVDVIQKLALKRRANCAAK